jgi:hypothetical protein
MSERASMSQIAITQESFNSREIRVRSRVGHFSQVRFERHRGRFLAVRQQDVTENRSVFVFDAATVFVSALFQSCDDRWFNVSHK